MNNPSFLPFFILGEKPRRIDYENFALPRAFEEVKGSVKDDSFRSMKTKMTSDRELVDSGKINLLMSSNLPKCADDSVMSNTLN